MSELIYDIYKDEKWERKKRLGEGMQEDWGWGHFFFNAGFELSVEIPRLKDPAAVGKAGRSFGEIGMSYVG